MNIGQSKHHCSTSDVTFGDRDSMYDSTDTSEGVMLTVDFLAAMGVLERFFRISA